MAKYGKFVTFDFVGLRDDELNSFIAVIKNAIGDDLESVEVVKRYANATKTSILNFKLKNSINLKKSNGDVVSGIKTLKFSINNNLGKIETSIGNYENKERYQYSVRMTTDGKYHEYRKHHKYDFTFEGKNHYLYGDSIYDDFQSDISNWVENVKNGIAF